MVSPLDAKAWRCDVTGNPVGTDTVMVGAPPCQCQGCRAAERIAELERGMETAITKAIDGSGLIAKEAIGELSVTLHKNFEAVIRTVEARTEAADAEVRTLREALEFTAKSAWRTDPPNANHRLSDTERLSAIKYHPTIKEFAKPHIELAKSEAAALRAKEP